MRNSPVHSMRRKEKVIFKKITNTISGNKNFKKSHKNKLDINLNNLYVRD